MKYIISLIAIVIVLLVGINLLIPNQADAPVQQEVPKIEIEDVTYNNNKDINMQQNDKNITMATFKTNKGDIEIELNGTDAPKTVENFVKLASEGFYDGVKFHRVIKGFMIQGGDPLSKDDSQKARWGTGGPGYTFEDEIHSNNRNDKYTIAMANAGPNTNGSQFFINANDNNFLDTKHTVFGRVVSGTEVVDAIENTATGEADRPLEPMIIESIVLE
jgi:peptidylprolyl isomerase/peptidyl-prolyl cis-trans isomerase A (cyclophilin A)